MFTSNSKEGLQKILDTADDILCAFGQMISIKKTEVLVVQPKISQEKTARVGKPKKTEVKVIVVDAPIITVRGQALVVTTSFKYVGSKVNNFADMSNEVGVRIQMMNAAFHRNKANLLLNFGLSRQLRLKAFVAFCLSAALYGSETWNIQQSDIDKLESHQFRLMRRVLGYSWMDGKSFASLIAEGRRSGVDILPIGAMISRSRLSYFGHVVRMDASRLPKAFLCAQLTRGETKRAQGGAELSLKESILNDLVAFGMFANKKLFRGNEAEVRWMEIAKLTEDRNKWRAAVKTDGVKFYMSEWYVARAEASNKRHMKSDGDSYVPKEAFEFHHIVKLVDLYAAIKSGALSVGRGRHQGRRENHQSAGGRTIMAVSAARTMFKNLKDP